MPDTSIPPTQRAPIGNCGYDPKIGPTTDDPYCIRPGTWKPHYPFCMGCGTMHDYPHCGGKDMAQEYCPISYGITLAEDERLVNVISAGAAVLMETRMVGVGRMGSVAIWINGTKMADFPKFEGRDNLEDVAKAIEAYLVASWR